MAVAVTVIVLFTWFDRSQQGLMTNPPRVGLSQSNLIQTLLARQALTLVDQHVLIDCDCSDKMSDFNA